MTTNLNTSPITKTANIPSGAQLIELEAAHTSGVYNKRLAMIVRGLGAKVWDADGNEYIDCVGGHGTANIGHANQSVAKAIYEQAQTLISCPEMFYNDKRAVLSASSV